MRDAKMTTIVDRSFIRTSNILFDHFSLETWLKLAFIAFFAGALFSSNSNFNSSRRAQHPLPSTSAVSSTQTAGVITSAAATKKSWQEQLASAPKIVWYAVSALVIFFIICIVLFIWVSSRFRFVWFHAIATQEVTIVEPFHRHESQGSSLFQVSLALSVVFWGLILALAGIIFYFADRAGALKPGFVWTAVFFLKLFAGPLALFLVLILFLIFFSIMMNHFIVPVMALDKISFLPAFKKVWGIFGTNKKDTFLFYLWLLLLSIGAGILGLILAVLCILVIALAGLVIFGLGYFCLVALVKSMPLFIVYSVILGVPFLTGVFLLFILISLPFAVFFRSYSIEYLCALNCGYSYESLENYAKEKSEERSKTFVALPILILSLLLLVFFVGLLAAIAAPNFIKAREAAKAKALATKPITTS